MVWCPKHRLRILSGRVAGRLGELVEQIAAENGWQIVANEVMPEHLHLHLFVRVGPSGAPAAVARRFKGLCARVLCQEFVFLERAKVLWSASYFAASVGYVSEAAFRRYLEHPWDAVA